VVLDVLEYDGGAHVGDLLALGERVEHEILQMLWVGTATWISVSSNPVTM